jgi:phosphoribosylamine--glycine ligase
LENDQVVTSGGRVLGLTAWANDIASAIDSAYSNVTSVSFEGMNYRKDIGQRALKGVK